MVGHDKMAGLLGRAGPQLLRRVKSQLKNDGNLSKMGSVSVN